jgi:hypothetical protein
VRPVDFVSREVNVEIRGSGYGFFGRTLLHPRLKMPMRLVDHLFFVAEHDDHHLAIIGGVIRA